MRAITNVEVLPCTDDTYIEEYNKATESLKTLELNDSVSEIFYNIGDGIYMSSNLGHISLFKSDFDVVIIDGVPKLQNIRIESVMKIAKLTFKNYVYWVKSMEIIDDENGSCLKDVPVNCLYDDFVKDIRFLDLGIKDDGVWTVETVKDENNKIKDVNFINRLADIEVENRFLDLI